MKTSATGASAADRAQGWPVPPRQAWFSIFIFLIIAVLAYLDRQVISLLVEPIRESLGVSDFQIGLLQGVAFGVFYALFGLPIGWLVDRTSRRGVIYVGMTLWSVAAAACGLASTYTHLLLARFGVGVGEASLSPAVYSLAADLFPVRRLSLAVGVFATGSSIGGALALFAGSVLIEKLEALGTVTVPIVGVLEPWQMVFICTGAPGVLVALLLWLVPEPKRTMNLLRTSAKGVKTGLIQLLASNKRYFTCHFLGFSLIVILAYGSAAWTPTMLIRHYGLSIGQVGAILGGTTLLFSVSGFLFSGWFVDRWFAKGCQDAHLRYYIYASLLGTVAAVIAYVVADSLWVFVPAYAVMLFLQPITGPAVAHLQMATPGELRGRMSAVFNLIFNLLGMCLGPPSVAFLTDFVFHDPQLVHYSLAVMYVTMALGAALTLWIGLPAARRAVAEQ